MNDNNVVNPTMIELADTKKSSKLSLNKLVDEDNVVNPTMIELMNPTKSSNPWSIELVNGVDFLEIRGVE